MYNMGNESSVLSCARGKMDDLTPFVLTLKGKDLNSLLSTA